MTSHNTIKVNPPRNLTGAERDLLSRLLSARFQGSTDLKMQEAEIKVNEVCNDCLTIGFDIPQDETIRADVNWSIPVEAEGFDLDGVKIHFLLHVYDGFIDELEIFREDLARVNQLPQPGQLMILTPD